MAFLLILLLGICLSIGTAGTFVAPINRWLVNDVPFFSGYREPQKFVMLIALAYAYFGGLAVGTIVQRLQTRKGVKEHAQTLAFMLCLIPVLCAPLMPWGFHGQLHANDYPVEWNAINDRLSAECAGNCKVLYLPWHLYMRYDFAGRIVADPAPKFFASQIIASNDPELQGATPYAVTILPAAEGGEDIGSALRQYGIHFVLLAKENDYRDYSYLDAQKNLHVVLDTPTLKLYEVSATHG